MVNCRSTTGNHQRTSSLNNHYPESIRNSDQSRWTDPSTSLHPGREEASNSSLLHPLSYTSTDYQGSNGLPESTEDGGSRRRLAFKSKSNITTNISELWRKKSSGILSQRTLSSFDGNFAEGKPGWWNKQMLVDRSLRTMAGFTTVCAIVMWIIVFCYVPAFARRTNKSSTSVGGKGGESCHTAESRNIVCNCEC